MSSRKLYSKTPTTVEQLLKLSVPDALMKLIATLTSEGIANEELLHSFYSALMQHSGNPSLCEKLLSKLMDFLKEELALLKVVERLCETLDELWDEQSRGVDRYDIPAFLRRAAD